MLCKLNFSIIFILMYVLLVFESKSMIEDEIYKFPNQSSVRKNVFDFSTIPRELTKEIFYSLQGNELLNLRRTSKGLKNIIDADYWDLHKVNITAKSSFPAIQDIKNTPFTSIVLSFEKWRQKDIETLLFFKKIQTVHLGGLYSWDFSTGELFNPMPCAYLASCILSILNAPIRFLAGVDLCSPPTWENLTSLDLSHSQIGDYGVICFVSKFKKLKILNISNNDIGRNIMGEAKAIANIKTLTSLNVSKNYFNNETISYIDELKNLTDLDISYNLVDDYVIIKRLISLPNLNHFANK